ncbi:MULTISPECIES: hypothetical protein [unclassified Clostridium]|uniref:hypothetical protein n=1 Tax=unclassified Clostridium TaxID=2614128 RepID=UPI000297CCA7|nr:MULTISPECIES: hypothetical protein [unclassified Clostridium]EKQ56093.1 MAG: hypothetical protein A370_02315 [Clostridium sp. Maddingley MBC34-26]
MDSKDNFLSKLKSYILSINDEYLIGVTNKGIFNRASKDLNSGAAVKITVEEASIKCELPDGNVCSINEDIQAFKCSCPSRSICKHTVMSYLYVKQHMEEIFGESSSLKEISDEQEELLQDYSELLNINLKSIKTALGDREFGNLVKRMEFGLKADIKEGALLQVEFEGEETVKFISVKGEEKKDISIKDSSIVNNSLCSCKSKELCRHKAEAVIHYGLYKGALNKEEIISFIAKDKVISKEVLESCIKEVRKTIEEIYFTGLARIPESFLDKLEQVAIICHNSDIPNMEKKIRALQGKLKLYINKNASFSVEGFRYLLQSIYILTMAMENCSDEKTLGELIGEHKSSYYEIPPIELTAVGANKWITESGYEGTTFYFTVEGFNKWFTYTISRNLSYDKKSGYSMETCPWGVASDIESFSKAKIKLINGKVNGDFRLSSSESSKGEVIGVTDLSSIYLKDKTFTLWKDLFLTVSKNSSLYFNEREENDDLFLVKPTKFGESSFDKVHQVFKMPLYDKEEECVSIEVKYSSHNKKLIEKLERIERMKNYPFMLLAKVYLGEAGLIAVPITAYYEDGTLVNLTL